jgi:hypothetical protein
MVVIPTGNPVAVNEFPDNEPGVGLHNIVGLMEAEPAQVIEAADKVFVQPGCVAEATTCGAGVMETVMTLLIGAHEPGGFMVSITVPLWLVMRVILVLLGTVRLPGMLIWPEFQLYGPRPGGAVIVAPDAPQVGSVMLGVPAGKPWLLPIMVIGRHCASMYT